MKVKVTKKLIKEGYKNIICTGYCNLQNLLKYKEADYYTCGIYGWNADIYKINNNTVIVTGYNPFGNIENYDLIKKYDQKAEKIVCDYSISWEKQKEKLEKLLDELIKKMIEGNEENE